MIDAWNLGVFITILLLTFALFLLLTGAFTAYFGSGKSRKIGGGLVVAGLVIGILWVFLVRTGGPLDSFLTVSLGSVAIQTILVLLAALIGALLAIGLFLLAIMKS